MFRVKCRFSRREVVYFEISIKLHIKLKDNNYFLKPQRSGYFLKEIFNFNFQYLAQLQQNNQDMIFNINN